MILCHSTDPGGQLNIELGVASGRRRGCQGNATTRGANDPSGEPLPVLLDDLLDFVLSGWDSSSRGGRRSMPNWFRAVTASGNWASRHGFTRDGACTGLIFGGAVSLLLLGGVGGAFLERPTTAFLSFNHNPSVARISTYCMKVSMSYLSASPSAWPPDHRANSACCRSRRSPAASRSSAASRRCPPTGRPCGFPGAGASPSGWAC